jgi:hypothetical protein
MRFDTAPAGWLAHVPAVPVSLHLFLPPELHGVNSPGPFVPPHVPIAVLAGEAVVKEMEVEARLVLIRHAAWPGRYEAFTEYRLMDARRVRN